MDIEGIFGLHAAYQKGEVSKAVHPDDGMFNTGQAWYYKVGRDAYYLILSQLAHSPLTEIKNVLDLPSGYGRVARHLRVGFPQATITTSDVMTDGVDFCAHVLGCDPLYSKPDLTSVSFGKRFEVIWVGSLFTHLDFTYFQKWIRHLISALAENGLLIATLHGEWTVKVKAQHNRSIDEGRFRLLESQYLERGTAFAPYANIKAVYGTPYGDSAFRPDVVVSEVLSIPDVRLQGYLERGWSDNQDVLVVKKVPRLKPWATSK